MASTQTTEPRSITVGDTVIWRKSFADYPASAGWALSYVLMQTSAKQTISASADGDDFLVTVAAASSASYEVGTFYLQGVVSKGTERFTVYSGKLLVKPDLSAQSAGYDSRTQAQKALDDALTAKAAYATNQSTVAEYEIAGRRMKFRSIEEIIKVINFWRNEVQREVAADRMTAGLDAGRKLYVRF